MSGLVLLTIMWRSLVACPPPCGGRPAHVVARMSADGHSGGRQRHRHYRPGSARSSRDEPEWPPIPRATGDPVREGLAVPWARGAGLLQVLAFNQRWTGAGRRDTLAARVRQSRRALLPPPTKRRSR